VSGQSLLRWSRNGPCYPQPDPQMSTTPSSWP
jgi:hypothetical protein